MSFCSNCGNPLDTTSKFCSNCGAPIAQAPVAQAPVAAPVIVESAPYIREVPVKAKVTGFIGMGLSIGGLIMAIIGLLYTFMFISIEPEAGFVFSIVFSLFSLPLSIVGRVLCKNSAAMGNRSSACSAGSKLGVAGIIVSGVMLFFGLISLSM